MKQPQLVTRLAREANLSRASAADRIDHVVYDILKRLRAGRPARLPGLGTLIRRDGKVEFKP